VKAAPSLIVVSGLSGAGRTTVMKALEDLDFYCADNLPVVLLERFVELFSEGASRLAVVIDVRERSFLAAFPEVCDRLRESGVLKELIFLDARDEDLVRRFDETRRIHPAAPQGSVREGISRERELLAPIAARADVILHTSDMSVHELKRIVTRHFTGGERGARMMVELISFGFRHGLPETADLMVDVRFLPNPNFEEELRYRTGLDPAVESYVLDKPRTRAFLSRFFDFLDYLLPLYEEEGKAFLTVAIGCTGGQHRSIAVASALERHLRDRKLEVRVTHRDSDAAVRREVS
jgi:UPF0042 nucleotide-binding protein